MAFWLIRSGRQLVRSSSWATPPLTRVLTSVSPSGGMNQESNPNKADAALKAVDMTATEFFFRKLRKAIFQDKPIPSTFDPEFRKFVDDNPEDDVADPAFRDLVLNCCAYFAKDMANTIQNKPVSSSDDFHKFLDDQFARLPDETASEIDQAEENPKATTPEMIKAVEEFADAITGGLSEYSPKPAFKIKGDNFHFTLDTNALYLTVNVSGLPKELFVVWVVRDRVLVTSYRKVAPDQKVREEIMLPGNHDYDPNEVTGTITEDGQLMISFPVSKEKGGEPEEKYFEVNVV